MTLKEIATQRSFSPSEMIMAAISEKVDLDKTERLLDIQVKWEANEAKKVFAASFAEAQKNMQTVVKKRINSQTHSKYAELGDVIEITQPIYTKEGFSLMFYEGDCPKENYIRVYVDILHSAGHIVTRHYDVPMDGKGLRGNDNMTAIHGKASSVSYGRRYLMYMIWNIPTADNDGNTQKLPMITDKQLHQLRDLLLVKKLSEKKLLEYLKIESLEDLPENQFTKALAAINSAKKGA